MPALLYISSPAPSFDPTKHLNVARIGVGQAVGDAGPDGVNIALPVVSRVHRVARVPALGVEAAVGALGDVVLGQDVRVEEVAWLVVAGAVGLGAVPSGRRLASSSAQRRVEGAIVVQPHAEVGVDAVVERGVDGTREDLRGAGEVGNGGRVRVRVDLGVAWENVSKIRSNME